MSYTLGLPYEVVAGHLLGAINSMLDFKDSQDKYPSFYHIEPEIFIVPAFCIAFHVSDDLWSLAVDEVITPQGEDFLCDSIIAARQSSRVVQPREKWESWLAKKYWPLADVFEAENEKRPLLLKKYLQKWESSSSFASELSLGQALGGARYCGEFAFCAAAAVMALDIDDSLVERNPYYPSELVEHFRNSKKNVG